jgi:hypothetical protein
MFTSGGMFDMWKIYYTTPELLIISNCNDQGPNVRFFCNSSNLTQGDWIS